MTVDQIRIANPVPDVLARYGVTVNRGRCKGFCHNGRDENMRVSENICHCFVCNRTFDVFDVVMFFDGCDFAQACRVLDGTNLSYAEYRRIETKRVQRATARKAELGRVEQYLLWRDEWLDLDLVERPRCPSDDIVPFAAAQQRKQILQYLMDCQPGW